MKLLGLLGAILKKKKEKKNRLLQICLVKSVVYLCDALSVIVVDVDLLRRAVAHRGHVVVHALRGRTCTAGHHIIVARGRVGLNVKH